MGNCCVVEGAVDHWIYVKTGDRKGSKRTAKLRILLTDHKGVTSVEIPLDVFPSTDLEKGKTDVYQAPPLGQDYGEVESVEVWRDDPGDPDWYCEVVVVNDRRTEKCFYFPINRWMKPGRRYKIQANDVSLPQLDPNIKDREQELAETRSEYKYGQRAPDLPVQAARLPEDEQFSDDDKWDIIASKDQLLAKAGLFRLREDEWIDMPQIKSIYGEQPFTRPAGLDRWNNDGAFGAQRLVGCNPTMIKLCTALPENMGVTEEMLKPFLEGWRLPQILAARRLFMMDLRILDDLPTKDDWPVCAPVALLFVTSDRRLLPIAIQLQQETAPENPVFLPNDAPFTWKLAKMWFNNADASVHMALSHIGFTNLLMEGIGVALHRHLAKAHPVHRLLAPHLLFIMTVNSRCIDELLATDNWVDQCMSIGREGVLELLRRGMDEWRMDVHGSLPKELETRGVLDARILPNYAYRDDAMLLHKAIENYVGKIIRHYLGKPGQLKGDPELQAWVAELVRPKEEGGVGINGVPGKGVVTRVDELVVICTCIIFTCSVQHTAVTLPMYDEYAFPPNFPAFMNGDPPTTRVERTEQELVECLPNQSVTYNTMALSKLFSSRTSKGLGEWEFQFQYDPPALRAVKEFRQELAQISKIIQSRNENRDDIFRYPYLDPDFVNNFIGV